MRLWLVAPLLLLALWNSAAHAQCAPAPDSPYFFRNLSEQRAEAKISDDRKVYEDLLSSNFAFKAADGKALSRPAYIDGELAAGHTDKRRRFYAIKDFTLIEHRQGYTVASYLLIEGAIADGETHTTESWQREAYEVQDGQWRLASVQTSPTPLAQPTETKPGG